MGLGGVVTSYVLPQMRQHPPHLPLGVWVSMGVYGKECAVDTDPCS